MHPPFGFALFYLRGIADTLFKNGALPKKVESKDIYLGAIPWVIMQLLLVVIVIFVPQTVTTFLDKEKAVDLNKATEMLEQMGGGRGGNDVPPALMPPSPAADGASAPAAADDPMEAVRRAIQQDQNKK
jgi:hypothetical protein